MEVKRILQEVDELKGLLRQIEQNGRNDTSEVWHKDRRDIDGQQIQVKLRCIIISVGDVDNVNQLFRAELFITARYREPALRGKSREEVDWTEQWDPRLVFVNCVTVEKQTVKHRLTYEDDDGFPSVIISLRVIGTFKELFELGDFPFDHQELGIHIRSDWKSRDVHLDRDELIKDSIRTKDFTDSHSWTLQPLVTSHQLEEERDSASSHAQYPNYIMKCHIVRKPGFYMWNVILITALIMLLTFASLSVSPDEPADRLSVTLTLMLTSVAFKFVVSQSLPQISYLTLLDVYVLFCMIFQGVMVVQNATASLFSAADGSARRYDLICTIILIAVIVIFHVVLGIILFVKVRRRNSLLRDMKKEYDTLCEEINERWHQKEKEKQERKAKADLKKKYSHKGPAVSQAVKAVRHGSSLNKSEQGEPPQYAPQKLFSHQQERLHDRESWVKNGAAFQNRTQPDPGTTSSSSGSDSEDSSTVQYRDRPIIAVKE